MYNSVQMFEPFKIKTYIFLKHRFERINHEVLSKTNRFTSFMTRSFRIFFGTFNIGFLVLLAITPLELLDTNLSVRLL